jgi:hypothetical protein
MHDGYALVTKLTTVLNLDNELCHAAKHATYEENLDCVFRACPAMIIQDKHDLHFLESMRRDIQLSIKELRPIRKADPIDWPFFLYAFEYITGGFWPVPCSFHSLVDHAGWLNSSLEFINDDNEAYEEYMEQHPVGPVPENFAWWW